MKKSLQELIKFGFTGIFMTVFNLFLFYLFMHYCSIQYLWSNIFSYIAAVILSYFINLNFTFNVGKHQTQKNTFVKYIFMRIIMLLIDTSMLYMLVEVFAFNIFYSKVFLIFIITFASFVFSKKILKGD